MRVSVWGYLVSLRKDFGNELCVAGWSREHGYMAVDFFVCLEVHVGCKVPLDGEFGELCSRWRGLIE
jgi:hypothetical protein